MNVYQCVKLGELWHLTQEQANPPLLTRLGSYTSCSVWANFKLGFEKRRPTCETCLRHALAEERKQKGSAWDWIQDADSSAPPPDDDDDA